MLKATFTLLAALAVGMLGMADAQAVALPVLVKPALQADTANQIVDVRYGSHGVHGGGYHGGYHGNYHRPYNGYNHRHAYWNPRYGRRCNGWTNYCRYHYNGYWYSNQWWIAPAVGVGVGLAIAGSSNSSRHVAWCENRYRSYNPRNNTWVSNSGKVKQCNSPYN